jgi:uncharacterized protein YbaR (Trm112 family)
MNLAPELLEILACPACLSPVSANEQESTLDCTSSDCGLRYRVEDDIPVMLVDEAIKPGAS